MRSSKILLCASLVLAAAVHAEVVTVTSGYGPSTGGRGANLHTGIGGCDDYGSSYGASTYTGMTIGTKGGTLQLESEYKYHDDTPNLKVQTARYFLSRWYDLIDIVDFSFGAGPGFLVNAHATKFFQVGLGYSDAYRVGFRGRSAGVWREKRLEAGVSILYYQKVKRERITGWIEDFRTDKMDLDTTAVYANNNDRSYTGIGGTIHALILVDFNVRPAQAADFVLGWFGIDILDDDTCKPRRNKDL
jgi:hypothetical protein